MIKTTGQKFREEGRIQGRKEGREEGCKVTAKALRIALASRFSELTDDQVLKIETATFTQLNIT